MLRLLGFLIAVFCSLPAHAREIRALFGLPDGRGRIVLDSPGLNARPDRVLVVTPIVPAGQEPAADYGVLYDSTRQRWLVAAVDGTPIDPATRFHVAALDPPEGLVHALGPENQADDGGTYLPFTDQYDVVLVTADLRGSSNPRPVAVRWSPGPGRWTLVNRDGSALPLGARFHVWRVDGQIVPSTQPIVSDAGYLPFITARQAPGYLRGQAGLRVRSVEERSEYTIAARSGQPATAGEWYNVVILQQQLEPGLAVSADPPPAPAAPTGRKVRVLLQNGAPASGAEVWANNALVGHTDGRGELNLPASVAFGDFVFARMVSRTVPSYRHPGPAFRAYKTSWDGAHSQPGSTSDVRLGSDRVKTLRLDHAMIGVTLHMSIEWDCTRSDLNWFRDSWREANDYLYDATDGQFFLEHVQVYDDGAQWDNCDFRQWANADGRASCLPRLYGLVNSHPWSYVNLPRGSGPATWMHEFGHYGLCLLDEYHETEGHPPGCTFIGHTDGPTDFHKKKPKAACIMCHHHDTHKICSGFRENPHHLGTRQGVNCWTQIRDCYPDGLVGPAERGFVPGKCVPHEAFKPSFEIHNRDRGTPAEMVVRFLGPPGNRSQGEPIWLESGGRSIFQGWSERTGTDKVPGRYSLHGAHVGDRVIHGNWGASFRLTAADLALEPGGLLAATQFELLAQKPEGGSEASPTGTRPVRSWLRADGTVQLEGAPLSAVQVAAVSDDKTQPASAGLPVNRPCALRVQQGDKVFLEQAALFDVQSAPTVEGQAASNDGLLMLEFPQSWSGRVAVSSGGEAAQLPPGLLSAPYQVDWAGGKGVQPMLKFRLLDVENPPEAAIYRYDPGSFSWVEVGGRFIKWIGYLQSAIDQPGCYALATPGMSVKAPAPVAPKPTPPVFEPTPQPPVDMPAAEHLTITEALPHAPGQLLLRASFTLNRSVGVVWRLSDAQGNLLRTSPAYRCGPGEATVQWVVEDLQPNSPHTATAMTEDGQVVSAPFSFVTPGYK